MPFKAIATLLLILSSATIRVDAQTVTGIVKDLASGMPIPDASVVLLDGRGRVQRGTLSEPDGSFVILAPNDGRYTIRVGAAGYTTKDTPELNLEEGSETQIDVLLVSDNPTAGPPGFAQRMDTGEGEFLTRQDIESSGTNAFTELLKYTPGVTIVPLPIQNPSETARGDTLGGARRLNTGSDFTVRLKPSRDTGGLAYRGEVSDDCVPVLWVDGLWWGPIDAASDRGPDAKLYPRELEAVELYNHPSVLPDQFNSGRDAQECGVVVVWTREGTTR